jgi:hypothetical protein
MDDKTDFARLERTTYGQCLVTIQAESKGDGEPWGPTIRIRLAEAHGVVPEITLGPWSDDEEGWAHVEKKMAEMDLQSAADEIASMMGGMMGGAD